ncbi:DDE superfamily endonuclease [Micromonospora pallida]|uniref:DDE superfamily endonuclease n=1 Tax=Micromonospora pallida TaxID=145854 RepID=A0A1C6TCW8_9ACTN|nr:transposase [Micromonospora pallida]SCL39305.1 DDE superfamily endonuclease [Micromonospora pallida]
MAAAYRVDVQRWSGLFNELMDTIGARFGRPEPRRLVAGLLAPLPVKNCWTIAEHAGNDGPGGMQDLIGRARWDDTLVRADVRDFVVARLGHPDGVLLIDETLDRFAWQRLIRMLMHRHRWNWKAVRRQFTTPTGRWLPITADGTEHQPIAATPVTRYRQRSIPSPWPAPDNA